MRHAMDLSTLGESGIKANLERYIQCFSKDAREIFDHFKFAEFIGLLNDANLLYKMVQKVRTMDLHPKAVSNYEMGLVFEELIRKFAESSNDTAGEHFTPRDIVRLTTSLVFMEDDEALTKPGIIRTIYDPTAGTGGFLSAGMEYVHELNPQAVMRAFGQELNPDTYAICKADMLIKGQDIANIICGNTLSDDGHPDKKFDYMMANPPFGGKERPEVQQNFPIKTGETAFLFLQHFIKSLKPGGRAAIVIKNTFLSNTDNAAVALRKELLENCNLHTILDCPGGTFIGAGVKTVVLCFTKGEPTQSTWFYQLNVGRNLGKTNPLNDHDLKEFVKLQASFADSDNSWALATSDLDKNTWDLSVKNPNAKEETALREPKDIIDEIIVLDKESEAILASIQELL